MKAKRKNIRVKLPVRQAEALECTLRNAIEFCHMNGAGEELLHWLKICERNVRTAVDHRHRIAGSQ